MNLDLKASTLDGMTRRRNEAATHLLDLRRTQQGSETWLPAVADVVDLQLVDFIEKCNEEILLMAERQQEPGAKRAVQLAFDFLFEYTLSDGEVPF